MFQYIVCEFVWEQLHPNGMGAPTHKSHKSDRVWIDLKCFIYTNLCSSAVRIVQGGTATTRAQKTRTVCEQPANEGPSVYDRVGDKVTTVQLAAKGTVGRTSTRAPWSREQVGQSPVRRQII